MSTKNVRKPRAPITRGTESLAPAEADSVRSSRLQPEWPTDGATRRPEIWKKSAN